MTWKRICLMLSVCALCSVTQAEPISPLQNGACKSCGCGEAVPAMTMTMVGQPACQTCQPASCQRCVQGVGRRTVRRPFARLLPRRRSVKPSVCAQSAPTCCAPIRRRRALRTRPARRVRVAAAGCGSCAQAAQVGCGCGQTTVASSCGCGGQVAGLASRRTAWRPGTLFKRVFRPRRRAASTCTNYAGCQPAPVQAMPVATGCGSCGTGCGAAPAVSNWAPAQPVVTGCADSVPFTNGSGPLAYFGDSCGAASTGCGGGCGDGGGCGTAPAPKRRRFFSQLFSVGQRRSACDSGCGQATPACNSGCTSGCGSAIGAPMTVGNGCASAMGAPAVSGNGCAAAVMSGNGVVVGNGCTDGLISAAPAAPAASAVPIIINKQAPMSAPANTTVAAPVGPAPVAPATPGYATDGLRIVSPTSPCVPSNGFGVWKSADVGTATAAPAVQSAQPATGTYEQSTIEAPAAPAPAAPTPASAPETDATDEAPGAEAPKTSQFQSPFREARYSR